MIGTSLTYRLTVERLLSVKRIGTDALVLAFDVTIRSAGGVVWSAVNRAAVSQ